MKISALPTGLKVLSDIFAAHGYVLYLVGGFVRNYILGIGGGDLDVCSDAHPDEAAMFIRSAGFKVIEKAPELGTIEIQLHLDQDRNIFDYTTFRRDYYPLDGKHRPDHVIYTTDIKEDARRRDFTINAVYMNIDSGRIIDPTGKGIEDIKKKTIRAAAENAEETIRDDGLRIMRMARFAAELGFSVDDALFGFVRKHASLLRDISAERKRDELKKILMADTRYPSLTSGKYPHREGLTLLRKIGALAFVLPRLCEGEGVAQSEAYHRHDVLGHAIHACASTPPQLELRLAALLHDIGKPYTLRESGMMYDHEKIGTLLAGEELDELRFENKIKRIVLPLIRNHMFDLEGKAKPKTIRKRAVKLGKDRFEQLIQLRRADFIGSGQCEGDVISADHWQIELNRMVETGVPWSVHDLKISGDEIISLLNMKPSPEVGRLLKTLFDECVVNPKLNKPEILKQKILAHSKTR